MSKNKQIRDTFIEIKKAFESLDKSRFTTAGVLPTKALTKKDRSFALYKRALRSIGEEEFNRKKKKAKCCLKIAQKTSR